MAKREIGWTRRTETGEKVEIYVRRAGDSWIFYNRARRNEPWSVLNDPPLEDWLELLSAVGRRTGRQLLRPEQAAKTKDMILERFPDADLPEG